MNKKISLIITTLNEESTMLSLLTSLKKQTFQPNEILIIDAGSTDRTQGLIRNSSLKKIKLIIRKGISRSKARNLGVKMAKNKIIAMTDAGCIAKKTWLKNLVRPIIHSDKSVVAGFYDMISENKLQKAMTVFLGTHPKEFIENFLPSTRSIAFTKKVWLLVNGFPENLNDTAEDSIFAKRLVDKKIEITRVKNARVEWRMPASLPIFLKKIYGYAKGDAQSKILWNSAKGIESHNIKVILVFLRYGVLLVLLVLSFYSMLPLYFFVGGFLSYFLYIFLKVYKRTKEVVSGLLGILLQLLVDFAVMLGFISGIIEG